MKGFLKFYLFERQTYGQRRNRDLPSACSLPTWPQQLVLGWDEARTQQLYLGFLSNGCQGLEFLVHLPLFCPNALAGMWIRNEAARTGAGAQMGCWYHKWQLNSMPRHLSRDILCFLSENKESSLALAVCFWLRVSFEIVDLLKA